MVADQPAASPLKVDPTRKPASKAKRNALPADRPLSRQEKRFAQLSAQGWPLYRCYIEATGATCKKSSAEVQAWKWRLRPAVESEIIRRRAALDGSTALARTEKRHILGSIARNEDSPETARIQAIMVDNRMTGEDEPQRSTGGSAVVVFTVDPIGEGTRGLGRVAVSEDSIRAAEGQLTIEAPADVSAAPIREAVKDAGGQVPEVAAVPAKPERAPAPNEPDPAP